MVTVDKRVHPVDTLPVLPVENRDAAVLVSLRVVAEILRLARGVVVAGEMIETERDAMGETLLRETVAALVHPTNALRSLDDDGAETAVPHDGGDIKPALIAGNVDKLHGHICSSSPPLLRHSCTRFLVCSYKKGRATFVARPITKRRWLSEPTPPHYLVCLMSTRAQERYARESLRVPCRPSLRLNCSPAV